MAYANKAPVSGSSVAKDPTTTSNTTVFRGDYRVFERFEDPDSSLFQVSPMHV